MCVMCDEMCVCVSEGMSASFDFQKKNQQHNKKPFNFKMNIMKMGIPVHPVFFTEFLFFIGRINSSVVI